MDTLMAAIEEHGDMIDKMDALLTRVERLVDKLQNEKELATEVDGYKQKNSSREIK